MLEVNRHIRRIRSSCLLKVVISRKTKSKQANTQMIVDGNRRTHPDHILDGRSCYF